MIPTAQLPLIISTDLDATLLDHYTYSFEPARELLGLLEANRVPVICNTSKTRAELEVNRRSLGNQHPFIVENGAAIVIPDNYFHADSLAVVCEQTRATYPSFILDKSNAGSVVLIFSEKREQWQRLLNGLPESLMACFQTFSQMGPEGIALDSGLALEDAQLANQREYTETLKWQGEDADLVRLRHLMEENGAKVTSGGRYTHISGHTNKGQALRVLFQLYEREFKQQYGDQAKLFSLALGDSANDISMLEQADAAVVVRSPVHNPPNLTRTDFYIGDCFGPEAWAEGVYAVILKQFNVSQKDLKSRN